MASTEPLPSGQIPVADHPERFDFDNSRFRGSRQLAVGEEERHDVGGGRQLQLAAFEQGDGLLEPEADGLGGFGVAGREGPALPLSVPAEAEAEVTGGRVSFEPGHDGLREDV